MVTGITYQLDWSTRCYGEKYDHRNCPNECAMWNWCASVCIRKKYYVPDKGTIWNRNNEDPYAENGE